MKPAIKRGYNADLLYQGLKEKLSFPNFEKIADAYGIKYLPIKTNKDIEKCITAEYLKSDEAIIFDVLTREDVEVYTVTTFHEEDGRISARPIEDMFPFLDKEELYSRIKLLPIY